MIRKFLKRHMLWVGFVAVLVPLGILLGLQYRWLTRLQETSTIAAEASLNNYLKAVSSEIEYFYYEQAERSLNIPGYYLCNGKLNKVAGYFSKKKVKGAKYLFVAKYTIESWVPDLPDSLLRNEVTEEVLIYDPYHAIAGTPTDPSVESAVHVALAPFRTMVQSSEQLLKQQRVVDEHDLDNRIIFNPITDGECRGAGVVGVAGMIVENTFFEEEVLPAIVDGLMEEFFDEAAREDLLVSARDGKGRLVLGHKPDEEPTYEASLKLPFIFTEWTLALSSRYASPAQKAKSLFLFNISLSVFLALALLGGVILALRTAMHEIRLSQVKSDFVSNVSHELRTPLASIRVFGEFLRLGRVDSETKSREYGEYIETESRRLTQLINNILDFSKIESEAKTYNFEPADLQEVVTDTLRTLEVSARHNGFTLSFEGPREPIPELLIDADAVAQALANLVDNAVKYSSSPGEIQIRLGREGDWVVVAVRDRGIGISRTEQKKVFERFHRVSTGLVHDVKGSGLGLSIVHHVIQAHGGKVTVDSDLGEGSTFFIHLPLAQQEPEAVALVAPPVTSAESTGKS